MVGYVCSFYFRHLLALCSKLAPSVLQLVAEIQIQSNPFVLMLYR